MSFCVCRQAPGYVEPAQIGPPPCKPELTPGLHHVTVEVEFLNAVIAAVCDVQHIILPNGQSAGIVEASFLRRGIAAPAREKFAGFVEFLNRMVISIG